MVVTIEKYIEKMKCKMKIEFKLFINTTKAYKKIMKY